MPKRTFEPELLPLPVAVARKNTAPAAVAPPETSGAASGPTGHTFTQISTLAPQTKLSVNQPGDQYEAEADTMANQVMGMSDVDGVQRASANISVSRQDGGGVTPADDVSGVVDDGLSGGGQPLDNETRSFMEPRFGVNFSDVRIHTDSKASDSSHALDAKAYAVGSNIAFRSGEYSPGSSDGKQLLAHELTHVVQQGGAGETDQVAPKLEASRMMVQRYQAGDSGHGGIEEQGLEDAGFTADEASQVYFGNWMRDLSQLPSKALPVVNILAIGEFGHGVDASMLGTYVPSEHLDNPLGGDTIENPDIEKLKDSTNPDDQARFKTYYDQLSPSQQKEFDKEHAQAPQIDAASKASGLPAYIERGKMHSKELFTQALQQGDNPEGKAMMGNGLHAVEDYFSHSNFVEAAIFEMYKGGEPVSPLMDKMSKTSLGTGAATAGGMDAKGNPKIFTGTYKPGDNDWVSRLELLKTEIHHGQLTKAFMLGLLKNMGLGMADVGRRLAERAADKSGASTAVGLGTGLIGGIGGAVVGGIGGAAEHSDDGVLEEVAGGVIGGLRGAVRGLRGGYAAGHDAVDAVAGGIGGTIGTIADLFALGSLEAIAAALMAVGIVLDLTPLGLLTDAAIDAAAEKETEGSAKEAPVDPATGKAPPTHSQIAKDAPDNELFAVSAALAQEVVTKIGGEMKTLWGGRTDPATSPVDATPVTSLVDKYVSTPDSDPWWQATVKASAVKK